jgi:pimeloyl-ACP methyl ester carboxylesterase
MLPQMSRTQGDPAPPPVDGEVARTESAAIRPVRFTGHDGGHGPIELIGDAEGDPAGIPVLLLHGGGQTRHAWGGTRSILARAGFHAIALDLRGHGDSSWTPDGEYGLPVFAADVHAVAAAIVRETGQKPAVVGASLGGLASLLAEGEGDPCLRALVMVDVSHRMEVAGVMRIVSFMRSGLEGFASLDDAADAIASYLPHRARRPDTRGLAKNLRQGADGRWRWHWDPRFVDRKRPDDTALAAERLARAARALRLPTLLVRGRLSDVLSEASAQEFLTLVPHAAYVDVHGAAHMVAGDENDVFSDAVIGFLKQL